MKKINRITERQNPSSQDIDKRSVREILHIINREDRTVADAVEKAIPHIERFVEVVIRCFRAGGRLIYVGSGTSGRLGVLDASECPPTFSVPPQMVQGIIAGGPEAVFRSVEGAEDIESDGRDAILKMDVNENDAVLGITASSCTPYVMAALDQAKSNGAFTGLLMCNPGEPPPYVDVAIPVITGPEIITGSTRMKAGTATKLVLNMITTTAMIRLNKTYGNLMVDLRAWNRKLWDRGVRIINHLTGMPEDEALELLKKCNGEVKTALLSHLKNLPPDEARTRLTRFQGSLRKALEN